MAHLHLGHLDLVNILLALNLGPDRLVSVRERHIEEDINDCRDTDPDGPDAAVDVRCADSDTRVLGASDLTDETGEVGDTTSDKGNDSAHVEPVPVELLGAGAETVEVDEVELALTDDPIVGDEDAARGTEEDRVAREERRE
jgi:hypothetical protein